jgi:hypothetical protein
VSADASSLSSTFIALSAASAAVLIVPAIANIVANILRIRSFSSSAWQEHGGFQCARAAQDLARRIGPGGRVQNLP